jgi:purine-binding chemotaxis protein CheW
MTIETIDNAPLEEESSAALEGKYLTFLLGEEVYGLGILKVQEIIGIMKVTAIPQVPEYVRGVINLRGKVIPVLELRSKFGLAACEDTERTCVIVVQVMEDAAQRTMGIIVDEVSEVADVREDNIEPPPSFGNTVETDFILGMAKIGDGVVTLLDVDDILSGQDVALSKCNITT